MAVSKVTSWTRRSVNTKTRPFKVTHYSARWLHSHVSVCTDLPLGPTYANVAESIFEDVAEDVDEEIVPANVGAWEEDDDVKSNLLNAFVTQTYNRNRRSNNGNRRAYSHIPSV